MSVTSATLNGAGAAVTSDLADARAGAERQRQDRNECRRDERHELAYFHIPSLEVTSTAKLGRLITP